MTYQLVQQTDENTYIVDGLALQLPKRTATFILDEENLTLINVGATPAIKHIKNSLIQLKSLLSRVKYIVVSDLELDAMGGLGILLQSCPNAEVVAPANFIETLTHPKELISATRAIYGDHFYDNFEPIKPVEKDLIKTVVNDETIDIGERTLQFIIPENAAFMLTYDQSHNHLYIGQALGVFYDQLQDDEVDLFLPRLPASLFDLDIYKQTLKSIDRLNVSALYFNHFGKTDKVNLALTQLDHWLELFMRITKETIEEKGNYNDLSRKLFTSVHHYLHEQNIPDDHQIYQYIILDINTTALSLLNYFK